MNIAGDLIQDLNEFSPLFNNSPPVMDELLIPYGNFRKKFGSHIEIVQEPVPLTEALVVADEIRHIDLIQLAQDPVDQLSSLGRSVLYDVQILRGEKDHMHDAEEFGCPADRNTADRDPLRLIFPKMHIDPIVVVIFIDVHADMCFRLSHPDHILIPASPMRL